MAAHSLKSAPSPSVRLAALRVHAPQQAVFVEERRLDALLDPIDPDLAPWDVARFAARSGASDLGQRLRGVDWTWRCFRREPVRADIAASLAQELVALRFPWTALVAIEPVLALALQRRRASVPLLAIAARALIETGHAEAARALLNRVSRPLPLELAVVEALFDEARPRSRAVFTFPGPPPFARATPVAPTDPIADFRGWLEADATGETMLARSLIGRALRNPPPTGPSWATLIQSTFRGASLLWPPRELSAAIVSIVASRPGISRHAAAFHAALILCHQAALHKGTRIAAAAMIESLAAGGILPGRIDLRLACCDGVHTRLHERRNP